MIGHASKSETGGITGTAGDQTGGEVCVRTWWDYGWDIVIRAKSAAVAEKMAKFVEGCCANDNIGYDQYERNTLRSAAKAAGWDAAKIGKCETDCAAFMAVAAEAAGVDVTKLYTSGNAPVTSWMRQMYKDTGAFDILTASKYRTTDAYLLRGDILVRETAHTVMVLTNGTSSGGEKHSGGGSSPTAPAEDDEPMYKIELSAPILKYGASGEWTLKMQRMLTYLGYDLGADGADGKFGYATKSALIAFQSDFMGSGEADGECGPKTWLALHMAM